MRNSFAACFTDATVGSFLGRNRSSSWPRRRGDAVEFGVGICARVVDGLEVREDARAGDRVAYVAFDSFEQAVAVADAPAAGDEDVQRDERAASGAAGAE